MKRALSVILIVGLVLLPCSFLVAADFSSDSSIIVTQINTGYDQWSLTSPTHYGAIYGGRNMYPINVCAINPFSTMSANVSPTNIYVDISDPAISEGCEIYISVGNAYGLFTVDSPVINMFDWDDSVPGYVPKFNGTSGYGFLKPTNYGSITAPTSTSITMSATRYRSGGSNSAGSLTVQKVSAATMLTQVPTTQGSGSVYHEPYWVSASSSMGLYKVTVNSTSNTGNNTVRCTLNSSALVKISPGSGTNMSINYSLLSAVFVPFCIVVPTAGYNAQMLEYLDDIVESLFNIQNDTSAMSTTMSSFYADFLRILGTPSDSHETVLFDLRRIISAIEVISGKLGSVTGDNPLWSSVQYIEYYLNRVTANTDEMVEYLSNIADTIEAMEQQISDTNDALDELDQTASDIHEQEQQIFEDNETALQNLAISEFDFDGWTATGIHAAGEVFTYIWLSIGPYAQVYSFALMLTVTMTILRYSTRRPKEKQTRSTKENKGG